MNVVFYLKSFISNTDYAVPSKMYYLFFEDKAALVWFWNFFMIFLILAVLKLVKVLIAKYINNKLKDLNSTEEKSYVNTLNRL